MVYQKTLGERINALLSNYSERSSESELYSEIINTLNDLKIPAEHGKLGIISHFPEKESGSYFIIKPNKNIIKKNKLRSKEGSKNSTLSTLIDIAHNRAIGDEIYSPLVEINKYGLLDKRKLTYPIIIASDKNRNTLERLYETSISNIEKNLEKQINNQIILIKKSNRPVASPSKKEYSSKIKTNLYNLI